MTASLSGKIKRLEKELKTAMDTMRARCLEKRKAAPRLGTPYSAYCPDCKDWHYYPKART